MPDIFGDGGAAGRLVRNLAALSEDEPGPKFDLQDMLMAFRHQMQNEIHTMMPGQIVAYYPATQTCDVKPMTKIVYYSDVEVDGVPPGGKIYQSWGTIPNVPVEFPGAGGFVLTFPVNPGDSCDIVFSEASIQDYMSSGSEASQQDTSRHSLAHAVVHPKFCPTSPSSDSSITANDAVVLGQRAGSTPVQLIINESYILLGKAAVNFVALANLVDANFAKLVNLFTAATPSGTETGLTSLKTAITAPNVFPSTAAAVTKAE